MIRTGAFNKTISVCLSFLLCIWCVPVQRAFAGTNSPQNTQNVEQTDSAEYADIAHQNSTDCSTADDNTVNADSSSIESSSLFDSKGDAVETIDVSAQTESASGAVITTQSLTSMGNSNPLPVDAGTYVLVNVKSGLVCSIANADTSEGSNAQLETNASSPARKFKITSAGNDSVFLTAVHSDQVLDVVASGTVEGTNVTQWTNYGNQNQKWKFVGDSLNDCQIISTCNNLALGTNSSNNVIMCNTEDDSTHWKLVNCQSISNGTYFLATTGDDTVVVDICGGSKSEGANATLYTKTGVRWQRFDITYLENGYYKIINLNSQQSLDVVAGGTTAGTNVSQWGYWGTPQQQWEITSTESGYKISSRCNGLPLSYSSATSGTNVNIGSLDSSSTWNFVDASPATSNVTLSTDSFYLSMATNTQYVLDIAGGSSNPGTNAQLFTKHESQWQKFKFVAEGNTGYYRIICVNSCQALDVVNGDIWPSTNVTQWNNLGTDNQLWAVVQNDDGTYCIYSKQSGLPLGAYSTNDCSNVQLCGLCDSSLYKWTLTKSSQASSKIADGSVYYLTNAADNSQTIDIVSGSYSEGANATLFSKTNVAWQRFKFIEVNSGEYRIMCLNSGQALDVVASGNTEGTNVTQWSYFGNPNQLWRVEESSDGSISLISCCNNLALGIAGAPADGVNVQMCDVDSADSTQRWLLEKCTTAESFKLYLDAGHGWGSSNDGEYDSGAVSGSYIEAELTSDLADRIADICRNVYGLCVYVNKTGNYKQRHSQAVSLMCTNLISIHFNSSEGWATGSESYIHESDPVSGSAAFRDIIHTALIEGMGLIDRGRKCDDFALVHGPLPSTLLEICFISTPSDMDVYFDRKEILANKLAAAINQSAQMEW